MADRSYKIKMPVMERICLHCGLDFKQHSDGKCLFEASDFSPGRVKVSRKMVKANVICGRCGGNKKDPEHEGACGACS